MCLPIILVTKIVTGANHIVVTIFFTILVLGISPIILGLVLSGFIKKDLIYHFLQWRGVRSLVSKIGLSSTKRSGKVWEAIFDGEHKKWVKIYISKDEIIRGKTERISSGGNKKAFLLSDAVILDHKDNILKKMNKEGMEGLYVELDKTSVIEIYK